MCTKPQTIMECPKVTDDCYIGCPHVYPHVRTDKCARPTCFASDVAECCVVHTSKIKGE